MAEYIDRTALGIGYADPKAFINPAHAEGWNTAIQIINEAPAADVAPVVHGQWVHVTGMNSKCSVCERYFPVNDFAKRPFDINFCPNCGAKMDLEG